jgi:nicotinamide riboside kinase
MSETTTPPAIEVQLPEPPLTKFERERRAFYRLLPELLNTHRGQYVAIHDEQVVDSGPVRAEVVFRALDRVRADIYVGLVSEGPEPMVRSGIRRVLGERQVGG